jgi:PPP family 3-phenylpropionic acid transporter
MAFATWRVFYNVYLEEHSFSGIQIGIINALIQATIFIVVPVWGVIADRKGIRPTMRFALFFTGIIMLGLGNVLHFGWLIFYIIVLLLFHHPLGPLIDALSVQFSESSPGYNYGNLRLWGSFGWAVASITGGYLFLHWNLKNLFPLTSLLFMVTIVFLQTPGRRSTVSYKPHFEHIRIKEIMSNRALLIFLIILFLYGMACSPVNAYMNLYFKELGADNSQIGIAYTIQALSELPFFIIGNRLLQHFGSRLVIIFSMTIMVLRMSIYAFIPSIPVALVACALQGMTLSFLLVGVVDYLHSQLPRSRHATAQSLLWGLYFGLGHTLGNLFIGILKDLKGMVGVMFVFVVFTFATLLITTFDFVFQFHTKRSKNK